MSQWKSKLTQNTDDLSVYLGRPESLVEGVATDGEVRVYGADLVAGEVGDGVLPAVLHLLGSGGGSWRRLPVDHQVDVGGGVGVLGQAADGDHVSDFGFVGPEDGHHRGGNWWTSLAII